MKSKLGAGSPATVFINGQEIQVDSWSIDITQDTVDVTSIGMPSRTMVCGPQSVTIELAGAHGSFTGPYEPREDIVRHLGTRCCCKHCPWEGNHA